MKFILYFFAIFAPTIAILSCPKDFILLNNKCLKVLDNYYIKHLEAETDCRQFGGTLVTIKNAIDNRALSTFASNKAIAWFWIGTYCFGNQTNSCYLDDNSGPLLYHNFAVGNPIVDGDHGSCVYTPTFGSDTGKWYSGPCEWTGLTAICEVPPTVEDPTCTHNYNGFCYSPSHILPILHPERTFYDAQKVCHNHGMELLSIHSRREIDFIKDLYNGTGVTGITLGAQSFLPGLFKWSDETKFDYENFDPLATTDGNCLQMDLSARPDNGMWSRRDCLGIKDFVCMRRISDSKILLAPKAQKVNSELSHCNSTLYLAPGVITSFNYPNNNTDSVYCSWKVAVLGPYKLGLYFTDFSVSTPVNIYSANGTLLASVDHDKKPFSVLAPTNIVTLNYDSGNSNGYHGFSATILPY